ncbi:MAG: HEAT repeat domain-containing protein, partial [Myxococcaceae bacterium]
GYCAGRIDEAQGDPGGASFRYREAAKAGHSEALTRLIGMLEHPKCRVRAYAAESLGELKAKQAKSKLEELAEKGGPGDNDIPLIGCSSRSRAREALERLR